IHPDCWCEGVSQRAAIVADAPRCPFEPKSAWGDDPTKAQKQGTSRLEPDAQTKLHLARLQSVGAGGLIRHHAPSLRAIDVHYRVGRLKVIQEVRELNDQRRPYPLRCTNLLGDRGVQVPRRE